MHNTWRLWQQRRCEHAEVTVVHNSGLEVHVCEACGHVGINLQEDRPMETAERAGGRPSNAERPQ